MNPTAIDDKFLGLLITLIAGTAITSVMSWKFLDPIIDVIIKEFQAGKKLAPFLTAVTVAGIMMLPVAVGAGIWLGYHYLNPEVVTSEPPKQAETQATPVPTPRSTSDSERAFKGRIRTNHRPAQAPTPETARADQAPLTPQTSPAPESAPPAQSPSPQPPAKRTLPLPVPTQPPVCNPAPPQTPIIAPGEKVPEPDQLV